MKLLLGVALADGVIPSTIKIVDGCGNILYNQKANAPFNRIELCVCTRKIRVIVKSESVGFNSIRFIGFPCVKRYMLNLAFGFDLPQFENTFTLYDANYNLALNGQLSFTKPI